MNLEDSYPISKSENYGKLDLNIASSYTRKSNTGPNFSPITSIGLFLFFIIPNCKKEFNHPSVPKE